MHSSEARPTACANTRRENAPSWAHLHLHAVRTMTPKDGFTASKYWSYFARTTCSVDATLTSARRVSRFPNYDPAPRQPPREMGVLYQNLRQSGQNTFRVLRPIAANRVTRQQDRSSLIVVKWKPMEQRNCSCFVKTKFVSVGGAKPAGLKRIELRM